MGKGSFKNLHCLVVCTCFLTVVILLKRLLLVMGEWIYCFLFSFSSSVVVIFGFYFFFILRRFVLFQSRKNDTSLHNQHVRLLGLGAASKRFLFLRRLLRQFYFMSGRQIYNRRILFAHLCHAEAVQNSSYYCNTRNGWFSQNLFRFVILLLQNSFNDSWLNVCNTLCTLYAILVRKTNIK